jgi:hypothetical protein
LVDRSAKVSGLVSLRLWKTLMTPFFWPTKTRPSAANWTTVGLVNPVSTTESVKPVGRVDPRAGACAVRATNGASSTSAKPAMRSRRGASKPETTAYPDPPLRGPAGKGPDGLEARCFYSENGSAETGVTATSEAAA